MFWDISDQQLRGSYHASGIEIFSWQTEFLDKLIPLTLLHELVEDVLLYIRIFLLVDE